MLFLQGTRDALADLKFVASDLRKARDADEVARPLKRQIIRFMCLKSSGRSDAEVLQELADTTASWADGIEEIQSNLLKMPKLSFL